MQSVAAASAPPGGRSSTLNSSSVPTRYQSVLPRGLRMQLRSAPVRSPGAAHAWRTAEGDSRASYGSIGLAGPDAAESRAQGGSRGDATPGVWGAALGTSTAREVLSRVSTNTALLPTVGDNTS